MAFEFALHPSHARFGDAVHQSPHPLMQDADLWCCHRHEGRGIQCKQGHLSLSFLFVFFRPDSALAANVMIDAYEFEREAAAIS